MIDYSEKYSSEITKATVKKVSKNLKQTNKSKIKNDENETMERCNLLKNDLPV